MDHKCSGNLGRGGGVGELSPYILRQRVGESTKQFPNRHRAQCEKSLMRMCCDHKCAEEIKGCVLFLASNPLNLQSR